MLQSGCRVGRMKKRKSWTLWLLLIIVTCSQYCSGQDKYFNDKKTLDAGDDRSAWMRDVPDTTKLAEMTIPGSHDSLALYGGPFAECQVWNLKTQLRAGIRYLDLRVSNTLNKAKSMTIVHGPSPQFITLNTVFKTLVNYLREYNTEAVLIRIKPEHLNQGNVKAKTFKLLNNEGFQDFVYPKINERAPNSPTMGDVRGKIVFLHYGSKFDHGIAFKSLHVKGEHKVTNMDDKWQTVSEHIDEAMRPSPDLRLLDIPFIDAGEDEEENQKYEDAVRKITLTYSSGTGVESCSPCITPKKVAKTINGKLAQMLKQNQNVAYGIIAVDFPGPDLIRILVDLNPKKRPNPGKRSVFRAAG